MQMSELPKSDNNFELRVKRVNKGRQRLKVVEIRSIPTPDAESRVLRAIDILLVSAAKELEASINVKKEEELPRNNPLAKAMKRRDEFQSSGKKARTTKGNT